MPGGIGYKVTLNFKMRFWVLTLKIAFSLEIKGFCGYNNVIKKRLKNPMGEQAYWFFVLPLTGAAPSGSHQMLPEECIKASFQWISKKKTGKK